ncbi:hypothetical protein [Pontibacter chinhatensis]|uniref:LTXXQ motif family protein n=1 Tax=Pontibacter chinhatensis TaxID=1436961 RepID=A0A1I2WVZ7_9BACT|nr:hypothetical protein [Pontibacter chinhatensis]SFH03811.1 hypothetical protein SAMN05421739_105162 [Pontibacter chinhatensis]
MKKIVFAIAFAIAAPSVFAQAQQPQAKTAQATQTLEQRAEAITAGFTKNLRLSPQQSQKVYAINLSSLKSAEEAQKKYKNNPKKLVTQMDMISQTRLSQLKDILTPQQFQQYQQRREEKMGVPREMQSNPAARQQNSAYQDSY